MAELALPNQLTEQFPEFKALRVFGTAEEPLFLAHDIQQLLNIVQIQYAAEYDENEDYFKIKVQHGGQIREMIAFTEHGLYAIIYRSRSQFGKKFRKFVTIILKELRTTGHVELSTAVEKLNKQLLDETKKLAAQQQLSEKYYFQLYEANSKILTLKNKVNSQELWERGSPEYKLQKFKEKYFRKAYLYIEPIPNKLKDDIEEYAVDDDFVESDERVWSVTLVKRDRDASALAYVPPKTTQQMLTEHLKDFAIADMKSRYLCSAQDLQDQIDQFEDTK